MPRVAPADAAPDPAQTDPAPPDPAQAAAAALLAKLAADAARIDRLRQALDRAQMERLRVEAALEALAPTLPPETRAEIGAAVAGARKTAEAPTARPASTAHAALVALLAGWERPVIAVGEAQACLEEAGLAQTRTYAAGALAALQARGYVAKASRGLYRINRLHPDMVAHRLAALEREVARLDEGDEWG